MKKIVHFSKLFVPFALMSVTLIILGFVGFFTKGPNLGIDFQAGLIEEVAIAPSAIELKYDGPAHVSIQLENIKMNIIISGVGAENETYEFLYGEYDTVGKIVEGINKLTGISAVANAPLSAPTMGMFGNSDSTTVLSALPYYIHYNDGKTIITKEDISEALASKIEASVKKVGKENENKFQIRVGDDGSDPEVSKTIQNTIASAIASSFGNNNYAIMKTDFIGSSFSATLLTASIAMVFGALLLIWGYASIRFHWDFALGAVFAVIHDALIMMTFITWMGLEVNSTIIAAVLTIIGYSINDTIVILDRVRENKRILKVDKFHKLLDISMSETLSRTIITTITTLLAVFSLYFFTSGTMKEFALALMVGMISGVYSTIFIAGGFISFCRRNWVPSDKEKETQVKVVEY